MNVFRDYLQEKELYIHFEHLEKSARTSILAKFYVEERMEILMEIFYKSSSLLSIRQRLNRHLKNPNGKEVRIIDIT